MVRVLPLDDLRRSPAAWLFEGRRHGDVALSFFVTTFPPGEGPALHTHPYAEVFLVEAGTATFTVAGEDHVAQEGTVLVVPAETPHRFSNAGAGPLRVLSIQPSDHVEQTNLES
jgi:quercetin dioxygenase-like cupin family protein